MWACPVGFQERCIVYLSISQSFWVNYIEGFLTVLCYSIIYIVYTSTPHRLGQYAYIVNEGNHWLLDKWQLSLIMLIIYDDLECVLVFLFPKTPERP